MRVFRILQILALAAAIAALISTQAWGQAHTQMKTLDVGEGGAFIIPEIGAVVTLEEKTLKIIDVLPADMKAKEYKDIEVKVGDQILMLNGKKLESVDKLETLYKEIKVGDEVKFGVRRGSGMLMISYAKAEEKAGGNMQIMTMSGPPGADPKGGSFNFNIEGDAEGILPVPELAVILGEENGQVKVLQMFPHAKEMYPAGGVQAGDIFTSINDTKIATSDEFQKVYDGIKIGETVTLGILRNGEDSIVKVLKPEQKMKIIKKGN